MMHVNSNNMGRESMPGSVHTPTSADVQLRAQADALYSNLSNGPELDFIKSRIRSYCASISASSIKKSELSKLLEYLMQGNLISVRSLAQTLIKDSSFRSSRFFGFKSTALTIVEDFLQLTKGLDAFSLCFAPWE